MRLFTLTQLTYFVTAVEAGSLNKAAKQLFVSQPALTKQLAQLEADLACKLLVRSQAGVELTEAGRFFYEKACGILEQVDQTLSGLKEYLQQPIMRLGTLPSLANYYLPDKIGLLQSTAGCTLSLTIADTTEEIIELLQNDQLDLAVVQDYVSDTEFVNTPLFEEPYRLLVPHNHPLAKQENIDFKQLHQEKMVVHKAPCNIRSAFRQRCLAYGIEPAIALELEFNEPITSFVAKGLGLSVVPDMVAANLHLPAVAARPFADHTYTRSIHLLSKTELPLDVKAIF